MGIRGGLAHWEAEEFGVELIDLTVGDLLDLRANEIPDKEAIIYNYPESGLELRLNYRQYNEVVNRLAKGLMALGVEKGDHIAVWATNIPEWIFLEMALAKIGAVLVTVNTNYKADEIEYVLRQGDIRMLFMIDGFRNNSYLESIYSILPEIRDLEDLLEQDIRNGKLPELRKVVLISNDPKPGMLSYSQVLDQSEEVTDEELKARQATVSPYDVAQMQYTSGTTGFPKGVMITHHSLVNQSHVATTRGGLRDDERYVSSMPLFHVAGCLGAVIYSVYLGCTLIPLVSFDPLKQLELFEKEKGSFTFAVPTMMIAMLNHPRFNEFDLSHLRSIFTGATPVPVAVMEQIKTMIGADCSIVFGMTETTGAVTQSFHNDSFELKAETVGLPQPHTSIKIIDPASGDTVKIGESGELLSKAFSNMKGYYNMPERTAETIDEDGWLHSGDLAVMHENGYIKIVGRVKDMIIRGGENIYPAEIEAFLMRHPKIAEAQVIGLPDEFMGEEVCALIRLKPGHDVTADELIEFCKAGISRHKVPKFIRLVDAFPLTASGKVKKFELREIIIRDMNLDDAGNIKTA